ncbi:G5 domain-containing protein [Solwaraspora sp. WMMA2056]|uniref:G5 domain-containing protein n=1 Tax=Solwaraspora sp. WMMA2056 TaxID=3015161 RepID=UPI00259B587A|nr:G5 domain-containing protein [Solwaraspora sp. WMMA2056]WJK41481.1 G5 domain-containing protein [Solwaraspora sp. WMMA2056]
MTNAPQHPNPQNPYSNSPYPAPGPAAAGPGLRPGQTGPGLSPGRKVAGILGGVLLTFVLFCCGGLAVIGAFAPEQSDTDTVDAAGLTGRTDNGSGSSGSVAGVPGASSPSASASPSVVPTPSASASPTLPPAPPRPKVETRTVTETEQIPFQEKRVDDPSLAKGATKVKTNGVAGVRTLTYEVTLTDGVQTGKRLISEQVTKQPVTKVVLVGTKVTQQCHSSYTGACVPIAADVDCAGGSGNGPAYVSGPVRVVGPDVYDLDRDGDGVACE